MKKNSLILKLLKGDYAVCKLEANAEVPNWIIKEEFYTITRTDEELSIACLDKDIPTDIEKENEWKILKIEGILDFSLIGILAKISTLLANHEISIFVISTFNTDYILIKENKIEEAMTILEKENYQIIK